MPKNETVVFQCEECAKVLSNEKNLMKHKLSHKLENKLICDKCGLSFVKKSLLMFHKCTSKREKMSFTKEQNTCICQKCGKTFANKSNLTKHLSLHGEKKQQCLHCHKRFHLKTALHEHISQVFEVYFNIPI